MERSAQGRDISRRPFEPKLARGTGNKLPHEPSFAGSVVAIVSTATDKGSYRICWPGLGCWPCGTGTREQVGGGAEIVLGLAVLRESRGHWLRARVKMPGKIAGSVLLPAKKGKTCQIPKDAKETVLPLHICGIGSRDAEANRECVSIGGEGADGIPFDRTGVPDSILAYREVFLEICIAGIRGGKAADNGRRVAVGVKCSGKPGSPIKLSDTAAWRWISGQDGGSRSVLYHATRSICLCCTLGESEDRAVQPPRVRSLVLGQGVSAASRYGWWRAPGMPRDRLRVHHDRSAIEVARIVWRCVDNCRQRFSAFCAQAEWISLRAWLTTSHGKLISRKRSAFIRFVAQSLPSTSRFIAVESSGLCARTHQGPPCGGWHRTARTDSCPPARDHALHHRMNFLAPSCHGRAARAATRIT